MRVDKFNNFCFSTFIVADNFHNEIRVNESEVVKDDRHSIEIQLIENRKVCTKIVQLKCIMNIFRALCSPYNKTFTQITIFRALSIFVSFYCGCDGDLSHLTPLSLPFNLIPTIHFTANVVSVVQYDCIMNIMKRAM